MGLGHLSGDLARAEPERLRYRILHAAARITRSGRRARLHLPAGWPWAEALVAAFARMSSLPRWPRSRPDRVGEDQQVAPDASRAARIRPHEEHPA